MAHFDYLFRLDAGAKAGHGHLVRCLTLAASLPQELNIGFWLGGEGSAEIEGRITDAGFDLLKPDQSFSATVGVIDMSYGPYFDAPGDLRQVAKTLDQSCKRIALIDGLLDAAVVRDYDWPLDAVIIPYEGGGAPDGKPEAPRTVWDCGGEFAVLAAKYQTVERPRTVSDGVTKVLVTHGGSDPFHLTEWSLEALNRTNCEVRVIVGASFGEDRLNALQGNPGVSVVTGLNDLFDEYLWCDIAIAATGLTKYELAASGTPSVQMSMDGLHDRVNKPFAALGTSTDIGVADTTTTVVLRKAIDDLINDNDLRLRQSQNGQRAVDGLGVTRITKLLEALRIKRH